MNSFILPSTTTSEAVVLLQARFKTMASKSLARIGIDQSLVSRCGKNNIKTCGDFLGKSELDLMCFLDIPHPVLREVIRFVSEKVAPKPVLLSEKLNTQNYLPTTLDALDQILRGGVPSGSITEIVGPSGVGKTQFCHMLAVLAAKDLESGVVYIDTEKAFSATRLVEIAEALDPLNFSRTQQSENLVNLAQRIVIYDNFTSSKEVLDRIQSLEEIIVEKRVKLIIIDSVASILRKDFDSSTNIQRQNMLSQEATALKYIAESFSIPIVVTNQITTMYNQGPSYGFQTDTHNKAQSNRIAPALGNYWAHSVNTRLVLEFGDPNSNANNVNPNLRRLTVAKSPSAPVVSFHYQIGAVGLRLDDLVADKNQNFWAQSISTRRN